MTSPTSRWIQEQAANGEPLNLLAVMRVRPDLIAAAFAGPQPRGWHRTLRDAGVNPYSIAHETLDTATCAICGYEGGVLGTHLQRAHDMESGDYAKEFGPEHPLSSESFRARKFVAPPIFCIQHWELLWSRFYVIDWIIRLHETRHDLNYFHIATHARGLANYGLKAWGSWDAALRVAGLDPHAERRQPVGEVWSPEKVIHHLREHAATLHQPMSVALGLAVRRYFGSLEAAAQAAGLCFMTLTGRRIFADGLVEQLVADLRSLATFRGAQRRRILLSLIRKHPQNPHIIQSFGSLKLLAQAHHIDPSVVSLVSYRDADDVHHDLDEIQRLGLPLRFQSFKGRYKRLYQVILDTGWGRERLVAPPPRS
jgi:hypothetical protein